MTEKHEPQEALCVIVEAIMSHVRHLGLPDEGAKNLFVLLMEDLESMLTKKYQKELDKTREEMRIFYATHGNMN